MTEETLSQEMKEKLLALGLKPSGSEFTSKDFVGFFPSGYIFFYEPDPVLGWVIRGSGKMKKLQFSASTLMDAKAKMIVYLKERKVTQV